MCLATCIAAMTCTESLGRCILQIGHNLGLLHASLDSNNDGVIDGNLMEGINGEYGEMSDPSECARSTLVVRCDTRICALC